MYRKFSAVAAALAALALSACGGGGGGGATPTPASPSEISVGGSVTSSRAAFFAQPTAQSAGRAKAQRARRQAAVAPSWNCDASYQARFGNLPKNVDSNGDGQPDMNVTNPSGIVTFSVDAFGNATPSINVGPPTPGALLVNKDVDCDGTADINIDTDHDNTPDKLVDVNGDDVPDYSVVDANTVSVVGASVKLTRKESGEVIEATTDNTGHFQARLKTGTYDIETRSHGADGAVIWGFAKGRALGDSGDMGAIGLTRNPLLTDITIDGQRVASSLRGTTFVSNQTRQLAVGDVVQIQVASEDPNGRPVTARAFGHLGSGYAELPVSGGVVSYTVAQSDLALTTLQILVELNNDDGINGADAYRDMLVTVNYPVAGAPAAPALQSISVNGTVYANAAPGAPMSVTASEVAPLSSVTLSAAYDASASSHPAARIEWYEGFATHQVEADSAQLPGAATDGVYNVAATVTLYLRDYASIGTINQVTIPVATADKPAQVNGLEVNGAAPAGRVFRVGDTLLLHPVVYDPNGRAMQCVVATLGAMYTESAWQACDAVTYTLTAADVTSSFRVRVWVRNDDGRVLDGAHQYDGMQTFSITVSE